MIVKPLLTAALSAVVFATAAMAQDFPKETALPRELVDPAYVTPLSGTDANMIRETVTRVYLAEDSRNFDAFHGLLTDDFIQIHQIYGRHEGAQDFIDWMVANPQGFDRYRHMALNVVTSATGPDRADALSYILVLDLHPMAGADATALPRILAHGVVRDSLRKENGQWRIARRTYDQFAVAAAVVPDEAARLDAAQSAHTPGAPD